MEIVDDGMSAHAFMVGHEVLVKGSEMRVEVARFPVGEVGDEDASGKIS